jgi:hypothetical protein
MGDVKVNSIAVAEMERECRSFHKHEPAPSRPRGHRSLRLDEIRLRRVLDYIAENLDQDKWYVKTTVGTVKTRISATVMRRQSLCSNSRLRASAS